MTDQAALRLGLSKDTAPARAGRSLWRFVRAIYHKIVVARQRTPRQLRLRESLSLGERRFVAVVEFGEARFLLGGTPQSLVLLAQLPESTRTGRSESVEPQSGDTPAEGSF